MIDLSPQPDELAAMYTPEQRARRTIPAIDGYVAAQGGAYAMEPLQTVASDLIADLLHTAALNGDADPETILESAVRDFRAERKDNG